jgi:hypothetical protein
MANRIVDEMKATKNFQNSLTFQFQSNKGWNRDLKLLLKAQGDFLDNVNAFGIGWAAAYYAWQGGSS